MLRPFAAVAALVLVALAGCGGGDGKESHVSNPPAQPYSERSTAPGAVARVTPADYRRPLATYTRYVRRQLGTLLGEVAVLRAAIARGDLAGARREIEAALTAAPHRVSTLFSVADVEKRQGDWQAVLATLDRAVAESPNHVRGLQAGRGEALLHLQRGPEAEAAYRKEVERYPDDVQSWGSLAAILAAQGRRDEARATVDQAVRINPGPAARKMAADVMEILR
jgi:tetratricopeptide (TPR) repeat protein